MTTAIALRNNYPALLTGSVDSYIQHVSRIPVLDVAEEQQLARRLKDANDLEAQTQIGMIYEYGSETIKSKSDEAIKSYRRAAELSGGGHRERTSRYPDAAIRRQVDARGRQRDCRSTV